MRTLIAIAFLTACTEPAQTVALDHPSPEPSTFTVERACPDPRTELSSRIAWDGTVVKECIPVEA